METNRKLKIAFELASSYDYIPTSGNKHEDIQSLYNHYMKYYVSDELEDLIVDELSEVINEFGSYTVDDVNYEIRQQYFNL